MHHTFSVYIDESGDDGLSKFREPGGHGGASSWLVISALVLRGVHSLDSVQWRDQINGILLDRKKRELHFAELNHGQKLAATKILGEKPVRCVSVLAHKLSIPPNTYKEKNQLYFYLCRYLIERVSWLCRDLRPRAPEGNGKAQITFSRRGGMSYQDFRGYLTKLSTIDTGDVRIHWPVIDIQSVEAQDHSRLASLQLADIVASAFSNAVEQDRYGNCEPRYAEHLLGRTYSRKGNYFSYGVKLLPELSRVPTSSDVGRFIALCK